jgi:ribonucleoside-diphosphate reductase alpha chain
MQQNRGWLGLPKFSQDMYQERYFLDNETYQDWLTRMSRYSDDEAMAQRIMKYIFSYWFHPSTPVSSNGNAPQRGLPISCYVNEVEDSKQGIFNKFTENNWLGAEGGGIGTSWSAVRAIGEKVGANGQSSGIIPFIKVSDSSTLAVSQGGLRRASQAVYLDVSHPEIEEFIDVRRPTGDGNRRSLNVHHGVVLSDAFMEAVEARGTWDLISPKTLKVVNTVDAFDLFKKILVNRMETGEPYMLFKDTVNELAPYEYQVLNKEITMSNLCAEIALHTAPDYTGVCCLASLNLEYWDEYKDDLQQVVYDCTRFLDNVLQDFIDLTDGKEGFEAARRSAINERSLGLGVMGFHSLLQKKTLPWESPMTKGLNMQIFTGIASCVDVANEKAALEFGECPMSEEISSGKRNINVTSIAPTASISTLCGATSQGIDPRLANAYIHKTNIGTYTIKNKYLEAVIKKHYDTNVFIQAAYIYKGWADSIWKSIVKNAGSVQHLDFLSSWEKDVFKTAIEINQFSTVDLAADRAPYITQAQSVNLFIPADEDVRNLYNLHIRSWKQKIKSLYYCRSTAAVRADSSGKAREIIEVDQCLSCQ